jgi:hypothetical protein
VVFNSHEFNGTAVQCYNYSTADVQRFENDYLSKITLHEDSTCLVIPNSFQNGIVEVLNSCQLNRYTVELNTAFSSTMANLKGIVHQAKAILIKQPYLKSFGFFV